MQEEVKRDKRCMYSVRVAHKSRRTCSFCINSSPFSHRPLAKINSTILKLTPMGVALADLLNGLALFLVKLLRLADEEKGRTRRGHTTCHAGLGRQRIRDFNRLCG